MTPEDTSRIVATIDRNTEAVERQTEWLKMEEEDPLLEVLQSIREWVKAIWLILAALFIMWLFTSAAKATPLLPPPETIVELGTPPLPPPNPHVQYWHTSYVPGPQGVLPVEVFAPRLVAQVASDAAVDVPEPGTWWLVGLAVVALIAGGWIWAALEEHKCKVHLELLNQKMHEALWYIAANGDEDSRAVATKALKEKP